MNHCSVRPQTLFLTTSQRPEPNPRNVVIHVMNDNMAASAHVGARLGAFFY